MTFEDLTAAEAKDVARRYAASLPAQWECLRADCAASDGPALARPGDDLEALADWMQRAHTADPTHVPDCAAPSVWAEIVPHLASHLSPRAQMWVDGVAHALAETLRRRWPEGQWVARNDRGDAFHRWPVLQIGTFEVCLPQRARVMTERLLEGTGSNAIFTKQLDLLLSNLDRTGLSPAGDDRGDAGILVDTSHGPDEVHILFDDATAHELSEAIDALCDALARDAAAQAVHREDRELVIVVPSPGVSPATVQTVIEHIWHRLVPT